MASESRKGAKRRYLAVIVTLMVVVVLWIPFTIGRVLLGVAPWGPRIAGKLPDGTEVYFQARPVHPVETDDRLTVVPPARRRSTTGSTGSTAALNTWS